MAIVIVVIGLGIGGFLVGKDLISAAEIRAQIGQYEEYNAGLKTFKLKYNALAGDMPTADAAAFGLSTVDVCPSPNSGSHGNGVIDGCNYRTSGTGESNLFWQQLGNSGLIKGKFDNLTTYTTDVKSYLPKAKIGGDSSYVYVWGGVRVYGSAVNGSLNNGKNYFAISNVTGWKDGGDTIIPSTSITPAQAFAIDTKIDDGLPQKGKVIAMGLFGSWSGAEWRGAFVYTSTDTGQTTQPVAGDSTTCYDNGGAGGTQQYSIKQNGGANITCVVSFEFQ